MLGYQSPQGELFRPDNLYLDHVGPDSFHGFLAKFRHQMFRDDDFAGMYRSDWGRPSVPPSQLCIALLLQARDGVSDDEAIQRTAYDLRWKVALGLEVDQKLCAKSTLQLFRAKLILHEKYQQVFEASIESCRRAGLLKRKKLEVAIDTTPVFGRGAVKDTFNLISDQIRTVIKAVVTLKDYDLEDLVAAEGLGRHFGKSFKGQVEIDWSDKEQKRSLIGQLVADSKVALKLGKAALRGYSKGEEKTESLRKALDLMGDLLLQDIDEEPEDGGDPCIRKGTSRDRTISTTDPEMRHGRKSHSTTFDGYKASVVAETENGVILATDVRPGNTHDSKGAVELTQEASCKAKQKVKRVIGDTAYGSVETRRDLAKDDVEMVAKAPPLSRRGDVEFTLSDFRIDSKRAVAICPAGKKSIRRGRVTKPNGWQYVFSRNDCNNCPMRAKCTTAKVTARTLTITEHTKELQRLRRHQKTKRFKSTYRKRIIVEHRIARLAQLGIRQARYIGLAKVAYQVSLAAAVANLGLALSRASTTLLQAFSSLLTTLRLTTTILGRENRRFRNPLPGIWVAVSIWRSHAPAVRMAVSRPDL